MRKLLIIFFISFSINAYSQDGNRDLDRRINSFESRTSTLAEEIDQLKGQLKKVSTENSKLKTSLRQSNDSLTSVVSRSLEVQAQNERAMNLALDSFKVKFDQQNKTVEAVQANLDEKFRNQLMIYILSLAIFVVVVIVASKAATNKGLKQGISNWNHFQEHFLKNNK
jgi:predicted RNase H-like nuclease (RuvC/YqgF family)